MEDTSDMRHHFDQKIEQKIRLISKEITVIYGERGSFQAADDHTY